MPPIPTPALVRVSTACPLGVLVELLHGPAAVGQLHQPWQRRGRRQVPAIPLPLAVCSRHRALAEEPALRSRADAMMAGGALGPTRGPGHAPGHTLFMEDGARSLAPGAASGPAGHRARPGPEKAARARLGG